jgi:protease-4
VVAQGRRQLKREEVLALADGRVVSGVEAAALKLVDRTGYLLDALEEAQKRAGIQSPTIVHYTRVASSGANIYTNAEDLRPAAGDVTLALRGGLAECPKLYYLWKPGW